MQKFMPVTNEQLYLLPPCKEDFIPAGHSARVINNFVETVDVKAIETKYSIPGKKSYHPHLLLTLLFYT
jgi:transposase